MIDDLSKVCSCGWKFPGPILRLDDQDSMTGEFLFACPDCHRSWSAKTVLENGAFFMQTPEEVPIRAKQEGQAPFLENQSVESTLEEIKFRGTVLSRCTIGMCCDGLGHLFLEDLKYPVCGAKMKATGPVTEKDQARGEEYICQACCDTVNRLELARVRRGGHP